MTFMIWWHINKLDERKKGRVVELMFMSADHLRRLYEELVVWDLKGVHCITISAASLVNMYSICRVLTEKKNVWNGRDCSDALILIFYQVSQTFQLTFPLSLFQLLSKIKQVTTPQVKQVKWIKYCVLYNGDRSRLRREGSFYPGQIQQCTGTS